MTSIKAPKKLIEVALPLDDINAAAVREKSIRHGHPSTLHLWWARRPLAVARAVLFAQLVNDPGYERNLKRGVNKKEAQKERERLFEIIRELVKWENTNNQEVLDEARAEIMKSWRETCELNRNHPRANELFNPDKLPAFHDPFAGGGAIPLEAQRLGLEAYASDLNPVAVLINKAMIEIPPKFAGRPPVGPRPTDEKQNAMHEDWPGARGLAEDVRRYGRWMRDEAEKRIGHLYPKVEVTAAMAKERPDLKPYVGRKLTVIAWLWARTVKSPNPAYRDVDVPLASTFMLSTKKGKETYVEPMIEGGSYRFTVRTGKPKDVEGAKKGTKLSRGSFRCLMSEAPIRYEYIDEEANAGRIGARHMAIVAEGDRERIYLEPMQQHEEIARTAKPEWKPDVKSRGTWASNAQGRYYGFRTFGDYFTPRQLVALTTLSDLVQEVRERIERDAIAAGVPADTRPVAEGGDGATAYAEALQAYLALATSRLADRNNSLCTWDSGPIGTRASTGGSARTASLRNLFSRQAVPMAWDYGEANPFSDSGGGYSSALEWVVPAVGFLVGFSAGNAATAEASVQSHSKDKVVSTDPPYYDNIGYADLSDFFYVWLRRSLRPTFPNLFETLAVPKAEELVATSYRHGGRENAETFFLDGMTRAMHRLAEQAHPAFPVTIYYAFKQSERKDKRGTASTGWETFLEAVSRAGLAVDGTWPMRTELGNRMIGSGTNALASSIVLVCRKRATDAATVSRRDFLRELREALPDALEDMTGGAAESAPIAPVDLAQAAIGPGMAVFSKYAFVLNADGSRMSVHDALIEINRQIDEFQNGKLGLLDADSQFCADWFESVQWTAGRFGEADVLARAKGTSVDGVRDAGVIESAGGKVRLYKTAEYPHDWEPESDARAPIWEALHHLVRALCAGGESAAGNLLARMPDRAEAIRQLAYRLYTLCERKGRAEDARSYNELITAWSGIETASHEAGPVGAQAELEI
jgi:putative DNA methylase